MPTPAEEIKAGFEKVQNEFHTFKQENDARLAKLEKRGAVGGDIEEKLDKHNEAIDKLVAQIEEQKTAMARMSAAPVDEEVSDKKVEKKMSEFMKRYLRKGERAITEAEIKEYRDLEMKALSVGSDPDGGYLVRPEVSAQITKKIFESSPIRQFAGKLSISTDAFEEPADFDEPDADWTGETSSRAETASNQLSMLRIPIFEMYAKPKITQKLIEDASVDVEAWHSMKVAERFARLEASAFIDGNGSNKPRGILQYPSGTSYGQVEQVVSGTSGAVTADGLIDLQHALLEAYQPNARWFMNRAVAKAVRKLTNGSGDYLWSMDGNLMDGYQQQLLGKPLHWAADMPVASASSLSVAYGDFAQGYLIVDRVGISVLRDPYSAKPYIELYTRKRVGGGVRNYQAIKLQVLST